MYDLIIIGLGPAGVAAGIYAGRKKIKTLIIGKDIGGQSVVSRSIENWIGSPSLPGIQMAMSLSEHLDLVKDCVERYEGYLAQSIEKKDDNGKISFSVKSSDREFMGKYVLIASGSRRRKLNIPGELEYSGRGVYYCSICDAALMEGKTTAVIGGGNAGLEAVIDLMEYADKIYLLEVDKALRGDSVTQEKVKGSPKVEIMLNTQALSIAGEDLVSGLTYRNLATEEEKVLDVKGIFIEIGSEPNTGMARGLVKMNDFGQIVVDPYTGKTSQDGIWAAGDVTDLPYKQNNTAMGDAVRAVLDINDHFVKNN